VPQTENLDLEGAVAISLDDWRPDKSYDNCLELCENLELIEIVTHGDEKFARVTQTGINVFHTLMRLAHISAYSENRLKKS
jgi:hypothetical protein